MITLFYFFFFSQFSCHEYNCHDLGLPLFLSHTLLYTHSHTHTRICILTHTSLSPPPVCHFNQRYCMICIQCVLLLVLELSFLTLSCPAWRCRRFLGFLGVLLPPPVSPVPQGLFSSSSFILWFFSSVSTHDRLPCFALSLKTVLTILLRLDPLFPIVTITLFKDCKRIY